jgi:hypothetical protein
MVPIYYGSRPGQSVVDREGRDVTNEFHRDLAFEAEFVDCNFQELRVAPPDEQSRLTQLFRRHGIAYVLDCSVCLEDDRIPIGD